MHVARSSRLSKGRVVGVSMLLLAGATLRCSGNEATPRKDPCTSVYAGQCGTACTADTECPAGLHCGAGQCTALCGGDVSLCGGGMGCTPAGRCLEPSSGNAGAGSSGPLLGIDAGPSDGGNVVLTDGADCPNIDLELGATTPTVVLLIDQSASMEEEPIDPLMPQGDDRWVGLKNALTGAGSVIQTLESQVRFGFSFYSNDDENPLSMNACPTVDLGTTAGLMPPALNNFAAFSTYFTPLDTWANTPTAESFEVVAAELAAFTEVGPKYIVLATDGEPDRCDNPQENTDEISRDMVVAAVQAAYQDQQISTFVIAVGDEIGLTHLHDVANAGQGFPATDPMDRYFLTTTQDALTAAFQTIIAGVRDCALSLNGKIDPAQSSTGTVTLDGVPLPMDPVNGWTAGPDGTTIIMNGTACDAVKTNAQFVSATFPCEAVLEPPK